MSERPVVVVLNGDPPTPEHLRALAATAPVHAADGGALACLRAGVKPDRITGDIDSLPANALPPDWPVDTQPDQNTTDFEKVLAGLPLGVNALIILGGTGCRLDHTFTNLTVAAAVPPDWRVEFQSRGQTLRRVTPACPLEWDLASGATVSLLPMGEVRGITTTGLYWNLRGGSLGPGKGSSQSNRAEGPVTVRLENGVLYVWKGET